MSSKSTSTTTSASCSSGEEGSSTCPQNKSNGLLLYYHHYSFYSQKVVMALHEKNLPYEPFLVDITKAVQFEPWFLDINPRGEVPVLVDAGKIIPDSIRIIDYLEDNFSNGNTPRLIPLDQGPEIRQKVIKFRQLIDQVQSGVITMGSVFHPEFVKHPKAPFLTPVRKLLAKAENNSSGMLRECAENNPTYRTILLQKADLQDKKHAMVVDKKQFTKTLDNLEGVLDQIEEELSKHVDDKEDWWLCSDRFTIADISLTILLERLNQLGFESRYWLGGRRPFIEKYYDRAQLRDSYVAAIPTNINHITTALNHVDRVYLSIGIGLIVAGGAILLKNLLR